MSTVSSFNCQISSHSTVNLFLFHTCFYGGWEGRNHFRKRERERASNSTMAVIFSSCLPAKMRQRNLTYHTICYSRYISLLSRKNETTFIAHSLRHCACKANDLFLSSLVTSVGRIGDQKLIRALHLVLFVKHVVHRYAFLASRALFFSLFLLAPLLDSRAFCPVFSNDPDPPWC
ncbi:hypothetical protein BDB00DRAFT_434240 [Zychaea mexicana]|uniref:uncharacterized protein n=1 Tax=Zychaea mexicana TaxID=64656 RepID=UPI0022FEF5AF|nr:uncharacterized protein BDB00DRAFT_434240 [Zychaea mexicana]KAI9492481.1 hypothetical protein BDB00DRAFT_434240 [Zychaea mexicana]